MNCAELAGPNQRPHLPLRQADEYGYFGYPKQERRQERARVLPCHAILA